MLTPGVPTPFPLHWGFSTRQDPPDSLPEPRLHQVHRCGVVEAPDAVVEADGLWTSRPGVRIGVRVADCVPVLLAGPVAGGTPWVAALHAGWRGATGHGDPEPGGGILRRGVARYRALGGNPQDLAWACGPAIQRCHFEVGTEVIEAARQDPAWRDDLQSAGPSGKAHLDLHGLLKAQALDLGLNPAKDGSMGLCTVCRPDLFHSYRRGDATGRQWGWIEIG
ncbi:MAG: polyphenol oxidase family protein [Geothrix sp.]|uniref:polyphenol oxidase family protein n=1 Tax=Geothrix sp. TaxID=1962974 RepID=UPI0017EF5149|nr:polyphenol oxidase family protein [Geothrix sp.]NWJ39541.1 polyphenol oxidase family protein [Geothrix sp.]WIL19238.1 MAG: polyphenol oxidase family protein [Geothrix sp.]